MRIPSGVTFLIILSLAASALGGPRKRVVAVMEIQNRSDIDQKMTSQLSDLLRTELSATGMFSVVDKGRQSEAVRKVVREMRRESYKECYDESCQIPVGKELAADSILRATISKIGDKVILQAELIDLAMSATVKAATSTSDGTEEGLLASIREVCKHLAGGPGTGGSEVVVEEVDEGNVDYGSDIVNPPVDDTGFVTIESRPEGATIFINGEQRGKTPRQLELPVGKYVVVCKQGALYHPARAEVLVGGNKKLKVAMSLKARFGVLEVTSQPSGAEVFINGEPTGQVTPFVFPPKRAGSYTILLRKELYLDEERRAELREGKEERFDVALRPNFGRLRVESEPAGLRVLVDGVEVEGRTPLEVERVASGVHRVEVSDSRYGGPGQRVDVRTGELSQVRLALQARLGVISVIASLDGGQGTAPVEAEVWVDGAKVGLTPLKETVEVGEHRVEIRHGEARPFKRAIVVEEGRKVSLEATLYAKALESPQAMAGGDVRVHTEMLEGAYAPARGPHWSTWLLTALAGATAVAGAVMGGMALSHKDEAWESYDGAQAGTRDMVDRAETEALGANISFVAAGALGASALIVGLVTARLQRESPLSLAPRPGGVMVRF